MYDEYELYLMEQIKQATGLQHIRSCDYEKWITSQLQNVQKYASLLRDIGFNNVLIAEIGKGVLDTVVPDLIKNYHDAIAITPFASTFSPSYRAYSGFLWEHPSEIIYTDKQIIAPTIQEVGTFITSLSTQSANQIRAMIKSYLVHHTEIWIGAYGNVYDENKLGNIATLENIKELLEEYNVSEIEEFHETDQGTYVSVVKSKFKTKELTLSR